MMSSGGLASTPPLDSPMTNARALRLRGRIVRRARPCGDGAPWEIWAAGASSPAGGSSLSGHPAAAVPAAWDLCSLLVPARTRGEPERHPRLSLGLLEPPFTHHGVLWQARGGPQCLETFRVRPDPGSGALNKAAWAARDSGRGITGVRVVE